LFETIGTLPGGTRSVGFDVNGVGQVVGSADTPDGDRAFVWEEGAGMTNLGTLPGGDVPGGFSEARAINDRGQVAGRSLSAGGTRAFLWESGTGMMSLGTLGGAFSQANSINAGGQVVGFADGPGGIRAFLWQAGAGMRNLGVLPGGNRSFAQGINDAGDVVGSSTSSLGTRAFLWREATGMLSLGTLDGGFSSEASSVNNRGQVVGSSSSSAGERAFIWENGVMSDLSSFVGLSDSWDLFAARGINDRGDILAFGQRIDGVDSYRGWLVLHDPTRAVAVPEPGALLLVGVGAGMLAIRSGHRRHRARA
jgi:probable HAF family extracellular repeat protein